MLPSFKSSDHEHRPSLFKFLKFSLLKFIPKYFILFDGIVVEVFLHSIFSCSLLLYRNTIDFCTLI